MADLATGGESSGIDLMESAAPPAPGLRLIASTLKNALYGENSVAACSVRPTRHPSQPTDCLRQRTPPPKNTSAPPCASPPAPTIPADGVLRSRQLPCLAVVAVAGHRLVGAVRAEQNDEWTEARRYMGLDLIAKARLHPIESESGNTGLPTELTA